MQTTHKSIITLATVVTLFGSVAVLAQTTGASPAPAKDPAAIQARMADRLKAADTDKDGFISRTEAEKNLPRLAQHFDDIDTNKDGLLSSDEFKAMHDKFLASHHRHFPHHGPGLMGADTNHDGIVTRDEVEAMSQKIMQNFDAADINKDGQLSRDEMRAMYRNMHASAKNRPRPPAAQNPS